MGPHIILVESERSVHHGIIGPFASKTIAIRWLEQTGLKKVPRKDKTVLDYWTIAGSLRLEYTDGSCTESFRVENPQCFVQSIMDPTLAKIVSD